MKTHSNFVSPRIYQDQKMISWQREKPGCNRLNWVTTTKLRRRGDAQRERKKLRVQDYRRRLRIGQGRIRLTKGGLRAKSCNEVWPRVDREWNPAIRFCPRIDRKRSPAIMFAQRWIASETLRWGFAQEWIASKVLWWCLPKGRLRVKPCDKVLLKGGLPDG